MILHEDMFPSFGLEGTSDVSVHCFCSLIICQSMINGRHDPPRSLRCGACDPGGSAALCLSGGGHQWHSTVLVGRQRVHPVSHKRPAPQKPNATVCHSGWFMLEPGSDLSRVPLQGVSQSPEDDGEVVHCTSKSSFQARNPSLT